MSWKLNSFVSLISFPKFLKSYWCSFNTFLRILKPKTQCRLVQKLFEFAFIGSKRKKPSLCRTFRHIWLGWKLTRFLTCYTLNPKTQCCMVQKLFELVFVGSITKKPSLWGLAGMLDWAGNFLVFCLFFFFNFFFPNFWKTYSSRRTWINFQGKWFVEC